MSYQPQSLYKVYTYIVKDHKALIDQRNSDLTFIIKPFFTKPYPIHIILFQCQWE